MRHNKKIFRLSRKKSHRKAMVKNLLCALIVNEKINTTHSKAQALSAYANRFIHRLIRINEDFNAIRHIKSHLSNSSEKMKAIAMTFYKNVKSSPVKTNYIRIEKMFIRQSDTAKISCVSLIQDSEDTSSRSMSSSQ